MLEGLPCGTEGYISCLAAGQTRLLARSGWSWVTALHSPQLGLRSVSLLPREWGGMTPKESLGR